MFVYLCHFYTWSFAVSNEELAYILLSQKKKKKQKKYNFGSASFTIIYCQMCKLTFYLPWPFTWSLRLEFRPY